MAKKKIVIETKYQVKGAENVKSAYDGIGEGAEEAASKTGEANEAIKGTGEATEGAKGGLKGMLNSMKAVVANPIGLILTALAATVKFMSSAIAGSEESSNKLAAAFAYVQGFVQPLTNAFNDFVGSLGEGEEGVMSFVDTFKTLMKFWYEQTIAPPLNAVLIIFNSFQNAIFRVRKAWADFTGDDELSEKMAKNIEESNNKIKENADAFVKFAENIADVVVIAAKVVKKVSEDGSDMLDEAIKKGEQMALTLMRIELEEQRLIKVRRSQEVQNDRALAQIEKLKRIRDDESKSFEERSANNAKISEIESKRLKDGIALAKAELSNIRNNMSARGASTELLDREAEKLKEIEALRSENEGIVVEQIMNANALKRDALQLEIDRVDRQLELDSILEESAVKLAMAKIKAEEDKIERLKELDIQERGIIEERNHALEIARKELILAQKEADEKLKEKKIKDAADSVKLAKETADRELKIKEAFNSGMIGFSDALTGALGENSKLAANIQKAIALRTIAIDTAQAISALVKNSQANPANAVSFGGAGALQFATGLLSIGTNMAKAYSLLKAPTPQLGGGSSSGSAPTTEQTAPSLGFEGKSAGSESFGANVAIKAYVTESDITTSQETSNNIQQLSQIG